MTAIFPLQGLAGHGSDRYGPIRELNFVRASFDLMFGSSLRPGLIKGTNAAHEYRREHRQAAAVSMETNLRVSPRD